jgi:hypothetical protein
MLKSQKIIYGQFQVSEVLSNAVENLTTIKTDCVVKTKTMNH